MYLSNKKQGGSGNNKKGCSGQVRIWLPRRQFGRTSQLGFMEDLSDQNSSAYPEFFSNSPPTQSSPIEHCPLNR